MPAEKHQPGGRPTKPRSSLPIILALMLACIAAVLITVEFAGLPQFRGFATHIRIIISAELTIFAIVLVELIGQTAISRFRRLGNESIGYSIRAVLRGAVYISLTIGIVATLAANPALAISLGTVSGVILGFATQNLIGNIIAGMILAIVRPVRVGDTISVAGSSGRVKEIALIYTILDTPDSTYHIPNVVMFSNAILRRKPVEKT